MIGCFLLDIISSVEWFWHRNKICHRPKRIESFLFIRLLNVSCEDLLERLLIGLVKIKVRVLSTRIVSFILIGVERFWVKDCSIVIEGIREVVEKDNFCKKIMMILSMGLRMVLRLSFLVTHKDMAKLLLICIVCVREWHMYSQMILLYFL